MPDSPSCITNADGSVTLTIPPFMITNAIIINGIKDAAGFPLQGICRTYPTNAPYDQPEPQPTPDAVASPTTTQSDPELLPGCLEPERCAYTGPDAGCLPPACPQAKSAPEQQSDSDSSTHTTIARRHVRVARDLCDLGSYGQAASHFRQAETCYRKAGNDRMQRNSRHMADLCKEMDQRNLEIMQTFNRTMVE